MFIPNNANPRVNKPCNIFNTYMYGNSDLLMEDYSGKLEKASEVYANVDNIGGKINKLRCSVDSKSEKWLTDHEKRTFLENKNLGIIHYQKSLNDFEQELIKHGRQDLVDSGGMQTLTKHLEELLKPGGFSFVCDMNKFIDLFGNNQNDTIYGYDADIARVAPVPDISLEKDKIYRMAVYSPTYDNNFNDPRYGRLLLDVVAPINYRNNKHLVPATDQNAICCKAGNKPLFNAICNTIEILNILDLPQPSLNQKSFLDCLNDRSMLLCNQELLNNMIKKCKNQQQHDTLVDFLAGLKHWHSKNDMKELSVYINGFVLRNTLKVMQPAIQPISFDLIVGKGGQLRYNEIGGWQKEKYEVSINMPVLNINDSDSPKDIQNKKHDIDKFLLSEVLTEMYKQVKQGKQITWYDNECLNETAVYKPNVIPGSFKDFINENYQSMSIPKEFLNDIIKLHDQKLSTQKSVQQSNSQYR